MGQAGLGEWGKNLARNFADLAELTWLSDPADGKSSEFTARYPHARWAGSLDEMLEDPELDAIVLATPVPTHHELAKRVLEAGKHVFVEKPPAMTAPEIDELVAIAGERDLVLMTEAGTCSEPFAVCSVSVRSRPDGVTTPVASTTRASAPSFDCMVRAPSSTGPQRKYGEALSHGSGRDTRYGTLKPNTSAALAVFPPELE